MSKQFYFSKVIELRWEIRVYVGNIKLKLEKKTVRVRLIINIQYSILLFF